MANYQKVSRTQLRSLTHDERLIKAFEDLFNAAFSTETVSGSHIADGTIHFTEGAIDHRNIQAIGSNSHPQIDTHITAGDAHIASTANPHNTSAANLARPQTTFITTTVNLTSAHWTAWIDDDAAGGAVTVNLPQASTVPGQVYNIKKMGTTANVTIDPYLTEQVERASTLVLIAQGEVANIQSDGSAWYLVQ